LGSSCQGALQAASSVCIMARVEGERLVEALVKLLRLKPERRKEIEAKVDAGEGLTLRNSNFDVSVLHEALRRTIAAGSPSIVKCDADDSIEGIMLDTTGEVLVSGGIDVSGHDNSDIGNEDYQCPCSPPNSDASEATVGKPLDKNEDTDASDEVSAVMIKRSAQIFVDISKTGRSTCRVCDEKIAVGSVRCGQDKFGNGITKTGYTHALCFLQCVSCDYAPAKRGRCQASEVGFARGDLRIKFDAVKTTYWLPEEAGKRIFSILEALKATPSLHAEAVACLNDMRGLHHLDPTHAGIVLELMLQGGSPPQERLHAVVQTPAKQPANRSHVGDRLERRRKSYQEGSGLPQPLAKMARLPSSARPDASEQTLPEQNRSGIFVSLKLAAATSFDLE